MKNAATSLAMAKAITDLMTENLDDLSDRGIWTQTPVRHRYAAICGLCSRTAQQYALAAGERLSGLPRCAVCGGWTYLVEDMIDWRE